MAAATTQHGALPRLFRPEHRCAIIAAACLVTTACWPAPAVILAAISVAFFWDVLRRYNLPVLTNLSFVVIVITLFILISFGALSSVFQEVTGRPVGNESVSADWTLQYLGMAVNGLVIGACFLKLPPNADRILRAISSVRIHCSLIYLVATYVPLLLNLALYFSVLRGQDYVEIHKAGLGSDKYILFLVIIAQAAFMRLFAGWAHLGKWPRLFATLSSVLFLYIYIFLIPLRTNLFVFGMYLLYFFGHRVRWWIKIAALSTVIVLFSWMAIHRGGMDDSIKEMGLANGSVEEMSFGLGMIQMIPWSYDVVRQQGPSWGGTYIAELAHSESAPSVRFVHEKAPAYADAGGGYGFFFVAELVLNFGYWGGILGCGILGGVLQKIATSVDTFIASTIAPALLSASFPLIRNDFMTTLKVPLYLVISCLILDAITSHWIYLGKLVRLKTAAQAATA